MSTLAATHTDLTPEINKAVRQLIWTLSFDVDHDDPDKLVNVANQGYRDKLKALVCEMVERAKN